MKIIKNILILACALTLAIPSESKASFTKSRLMAFSVLGLGVYNLGNYLGEKLFNSGYQPSFLKSEDGKNRQILNISEGEKKRQMLNEQFWSHLTEGSFEGVEASLSIGANANARNPRDIDITPLAGAINVDVRLSIEDRNLLDRQLNIIKILLAHGAIDYERAAYKKALNAYNYYVKKAQNNNLYAQFASRYKAILNALETSTSVNYGSLSQN